MRISGVATRRTCVFPMLKARDERGGGRARAWWGGARRAPWPARAVPPCSTAPNHPNDSHPASAVGQVRLPQMRLHPGPVCADRRRRDARVVPPVPVQGPVRRQLPGDGVRKLSKGDHPGSPRLRARRPPAPPEGRRATRRPDRRVPPGRAGGRDGHLRQFLRHLPQRPPRLPRVRHRARGGWRVGGGVEGRRAALRARRGGARHPLTPTHTHPPPPPTHIPPPTPSRPTTC